MVLNWGAACNVAKESLRSVLYVTIYDSTNEIVLNERTGSAARGELAARTTYQRAAKGAIAVSECPPDGKRVRLENTGKKVQFTCVLIYFSLCMFMLCHIICGYLLIIFRRVFAMMSSLSVLSIVDAMCLFIYFTILCQYQTCIDSKSCYLFINLFIEKIVYQMYLLIILY